MITDLAAVHARLYNKVDVHIRFRDKVLGGLPKGGNPLDFWMELKNMSDDEKVEFKTRLKAGTVSAEELEEIKDASCCVFERDTEKCLVMWHGNLKAALREAFVTLGKTQMRGAGEVVVVEEPVKKDDEKIKTKVPKCGGGRQTLQHGVHVEPLRIRLLRKGKPITEPDGVENRVKHVTGPTGPRSALGQYEMLLCPEMKFTVLWPAKGCFKREDIEEVLVFIAQNGAGASRSQGYGKFEILSIK